MPKHSRKRSVIKKRKRRQKRAQLANEAKLRLLAQKKADKNA